MISKSLLSILVLTLGLTVNAGETPLDRNLQALSDCEILPRVEVGYHTYNYGVLMNGRPIVGAHTLESALDRLDRLRSAGQCGPSMYTKACDVTARPFIGYLTYAYGITANGENLTGVNTFNSALRVIEDLRFRQYCSVKPGDCVISPSVEIEYMVYSYGIEKDGVAVAGANSFKEANSYLQQMQHLGLCYR